MLRRVSHPAEGVTHRAVEVPRLEVELMMDTALHAAVPDDAAHRIPQRRHFAHVQTWGSSMSSPDESTSLSGNQSR